MNSRLGVLLVVFLIGIAFVLSVRSEERLSTSREQSRILVALLPFELSGEAPADVANSIMEKVIATLRADQRLDIVSGVTFQSILESNRALGRSDTEYSVTYLIKGWVYAEGELKLAGLKLLDAKSGETLWFGNYDYGGITGEMMAADILECLQSLPCSRDRE
jgi:TolB-like protein